jgi:transcriptional regulator with XRE-family HTH domain
MPRGTPRLRTQDKRLNIAGERIRQRRRELDLRQDQLCARVAATTSGEWSPGWQDLSRIENGSRIVSDVEVLALAQALESDACWLLLGR